MASMKPKKSREFGTDRHHVLWPGKLSTKLDSSANLSFGCGGKGNTPARIWEVIGEWSICF